MSMTLEQFRQWALAQKQVANPGTGTYPGQCVSLVQQYLYQVFGVPYAPRGNARYFVPPTFTRVTGAYKPGDIIRYGANYGGGDGHVGLIDDNGQWLDQNGVVKLHVGVRAVPFRAYESIWRPTKPFTLKAPTAPAQAGMPAIGSSIQLIPTQVRTTWKPGTTTAAGHINVVNNDFIYIVRGYDPKYPYRIIINSASGGGNGVALALHYTNGKLITGWKQL